MAIQDFTAGQVLTAAQMDSLQANDYNWTVSTKTASYTLAATDKGTRVVMNSGSATTITVNTSIFAAGDTLFIQNINTGTCTITAGTCTVNTASSLALAQWQGGVLYFTSASTAIFFLAGGISYGTATGGSSSSISVSGVNYTLLTFTTDQNLVVSKSGLFDVLLIGGGGAGGSGAAARASGGGGAGGVLGFTAITTIYLPAATYAVDVGAGGAGVAADNTSGRFGLGSSIGSIISTAGGAGGDGGAALADRDGTGGSTGGRAGIRTTATDRIATSIQGNLGGATDGSAFTNAGGGGGAGGNGGASSGTTGGTGGAGIDVTTFIGSSYVAAAGAGGGGSVTGGTAATGGVAGKATGIGNNGVNYGAGGGGTYGAGATNYGGNGAAGVVYVRFKV